MPNRMLSGEIARSESLSRVSLEAETTFFHLISVADDFGRFDGRPAILLAALFPTRLETVSIEALSRWLAELEREGLLRWYVVAGRRYVLLTGWSKHQRAPRAEKSKYPEPPAHEDAPQSPVSDPRSNVSEPLTNAPVFSEVGVEGVGEGEGDRDSRPPAAPALTRPPDGAPAPVPEPPEPPHRPNGTTNGHARAKRPRDVLMPKDFTPEQHERLRRLVARHELSEAEVLYACHRVFAWSHGNGKARSDWVLVVANAVHDGWARKGFS